MRKHFEGGGHRNAAGGRSYDTLENTVNKLEDVLAMYKAELALTHKDTTEC
jgi:phosphoesterase RecJ-like protein